MCCVKIFLHKGKPEAVAAKFVKIFMTPAPQKKISTLTVLIMSLSYFLIPHSMSTYREQTIHFQESVNFNQFSIIHSVQDFFTSILLLINN